MDAALPRVGIYALQQDRPSSPRGYTKIRVRGPATDTVLGLLVACLTRCGLAVSYAGPVQPPATPDDPPDYPITVTIAGDRGAHADAITAVGQAVHVGGVLLD